MIFEFQFFLLNVERQNMQTSEYQIAEYIMGFGILLLASFALPHFENGS